MFNLRFLLGVPAALLLACAQQSAPAPGSGVPDDASDVTPVLIGERAPGFELSLASGETYTFDPDNREAPAIIVFYRGGWCPYCGAHLMDMRRAEEAVLEMGYELLFLSADSVESLARSLEEKDIQYTLLSDNDLVAAKAYGVAFKVDPATVARYLEHGIDLEKESGRTHQMLPVPAVFIVGVDGEIKFEYVNPNYRVRVDPDLLTVAARTALTQKPLTPLRR